VLITTHGSVLVMPAHEANWQDFEAVFGMRGEAFKCQCKRYKLLPGESFASFPVDERAERLCQQTNCGHRDATTTSGLLAYLDGEPVGWCAVEPRTAYAGLLRVYRDPCLGRAEHRFDDSIWAVTCVLARAGFRRRGVSRAAVDFAQARGARALEAYPMIVQPGQDVTWGELHVGSRSIFSAAGFKEVSRPTPRRVMMRIDF
jgi:hypothetical protein